MTIRLSHYSTVIVCLLLALAFRTAEANEYPERIVSLGPINTENVFLLGAGDRLVGNTQYCVRPEAARYKEKIGSVLQVSVEKIISLRPDLILATAMTRPSQVQQLKAVGIKVVQFGQPSSFAEICRHFTRLGDLLGVKDKAGQIVSQAQDKIWAIRERVAGLPRQKVFLQVGSHPLFGSVNNSFTHDFIGMAGGINIIEDQRSGKTSYEKVLAHNPDCIIIAIMGSETGIAAQEKKNWQRFSVIKAVQEDRVYVINPDQVCSPSPITFVQTLGIIAGLIHPKIAMEENQ